ncbi:MARVEL domain-containing protein 3 [Etheostoma spectabile]|uniref:MARVEL domain-containing protein 3 n=1 Tax=Etheostoma spectabile TaxID=54343 RepID=UPI0013AE8EF7|nr:MARVEL domain-containing protein 3-like [Etheostoma spectabile]
MSQPSGSNRGHRDRNGDHHHRDSSHGYRRSSPDDSSSSRAPYYPREGNSPPKPKHVRQVSRVEPHESKCSQICSRRGIVLIVAVLTNSLVLICLIASQMVTSGMSAMGGMGGFDINSNFNMEGTEIQKARELDIQYSQMRAPGMYGGIPFTLILGVLSLLFAVAGNKPPHLMSRKLLYGALVFQAVGAVVLVVAVGLYLHFIVTVNSTDVCKQRERLYARNGYTWMNCSVSGADAAVALFGIITAILYAVGTALTFQTIRGVRRYLEEGKRREAEKQKGRAEAQRSPLRAETIFV